MSCTTDEGRGTPMHPQLQGSCGRRSRGPVSHDPACFQHSSGCARSQVVESSGQFPISGRGSVKRVVIARWVGAVVKVRGRGGRQSAGVG